MLGLLGYLVLASQSLDTYLKEQMVVQVFMAPNATPEQAEAAAAQIRSQEFMKELTIISKEQAAKDFSNELGQDFVSFLGFNPLMTSLQLRVKEAYTNAEDLQRMEGFLKSVDGVQEVSYPRMAFEAAGKNIRTVELVFLGLAAVFALIAVVLIHNTVKLNLYARRFLIRSMQLVGATPWFITKPFIWQSVKNGFWGWLIALALLVFLNQSIPGWIPEWSQFMNTVSLLELYGVLLVAGLCISILSSVISTRKYLYARLEDLY